jgi:peptide/nickel transport system permease protein
MATARITEKIRDWEGVTRNALRGAPTIPLVILLAIMMMAVWASWISPHSPVEASLSHRLLPPAWMEGGSPDYLLGTDRYGRDVLSRVIYGARVSMLVAFLSIIVTLFAGALIGLTSGYFGGRVDGVLMRITDVGLSFPSILIALVLAVIFGPSFTNVILIVLLVFWPRFARQVRGETLAIKQQDFVILARAMGVSSWKVMWRHIFPNVVPSLLVLSTLEVAHVVIFEATLSFLGVGIPPPNPSLGSIIAEGRAYLDSAWWISIFAGAAIVLTVFALNMTGDWVRDRLDPTLRQV